MSTSKPISSPTFELQSMQTMNGALSHLVDFIGYRLECCTPAVIKTYDRNSHMATVTPLQKFAYRNGTSLMYSERADIYNVSVLRFQHGGFLFDAPLFEGDTGWLVAADRDTSTVKQMNDKDVTSKGSQNKGAQNPATLQYHKYHFGFFIPDRWGTIEFKEEYKDWLVLESRSGKSVIRMNVEGTIDITNNSGAKILLKEDGGIEISSSSGNNISFLSPVDFSESVNVSKTLIANEGISTNGGVIATGDVVGNGVSLSGHKHYDINDQETSGPTTILPPAPPELGHGYGTLTFQGQVFNTLSSPTSEELTPEGYAQYSISLDPFPARYASFMPFMKFVETVNGETSQTPISFRNSVDGEEQEYLYHIYNKNQPTDIPKIFVKPPRGATTYTISSIPYET